MMDKSNKRFLFNLEWVEVLRELPREVRYEVYDAIMDYVASGTTPDLKPTALGVFLFIKKEIDYNAARYQSSLDNCAQTGVSKPKRGNPNFAKGNPNPYYRKPGNKDEKIIQDNSDIIQDNSDNSLSNNDNNNDNDNKYISPPYNPPGGIISAVTAAKDSVMREFFEKKAIQVDSFCMTNHTTPEELRRLANEIFDEWELVNETDLTSRHLLNSLRKKIQFRNKNETQKREDRLSERRGTEPGAKSRKGFDGAF